MNFGYISSLPQNDEEDIIQEAWLKALEKTSKRPQAVTKEELVSGYDHIAGLVVHIFRHEKINQYRRSNRRTVPLTKDIPVWYTTEDALEECTPEQIEAITYYLHVTSQDRPLTENERQKLRRFRKKTGLALRVEHNNKGKGVK
jgi:DNA-directed RNA polymerase specialized sigma24 family protein